MSVARVRYAFNSTNVEGWGLYSEYIMQPYMPLEGQLMSLRLSPAARGARVSRSGVAGGQGDAGAGQARCWRTTWCSHRPSRRRKWSATRIARPGQANSYYYGYTKLLALRKDTEAAMGAKFDQKKFHDFILAQGLLPPDLYAQVGDDGFRWNSRDCGFELSRKRVPRSCSFRQVADECRWRIPQRISAYGSAPLAKSDRGLRRWW